MTCDESLNLLSAKIDSELSTEDRANLETHLAGCVACRSAHAAMLVQDANLRKAFAPMKKNGQIVADRVIATLPARPARRIPWLAMIASAAAGFAVAFGVLRHAAPSPVASGPSTTVSTRSAPVATLSLSTGAVQFRCPGDSDWSPMATGARVDAGTRVRTGPEVRCEFRTADGSEIRLNAETEINLKAPRRFELADGEVWSTVAHDPVPFEALASGAQFTALGTQFDLVARSQSTMLSVAEGSVRVNSGTNEFVCATGEQLKVTDGHLGDKKATEDLETATRWVNEILVMKGRDNPELARRIDDLFAQLGQSKMGFLYENEIRGLGDHSVIPLTKYIQSDRSNGQPAKRLVAAKIVADVALPWAIPELIGLLSDSDGNVRSAAAGGLKRLTGLDMGRSPEQWLGSELGLCETTTEQWRKWWKENRRLYPGASVEAPLRKG